jgi:fusion and transport protein UGO1
LTFIPPQHSTPNSTQPTHSYQWSTRPSQNSIFDLSPSLDLRESSGIDVALLVRSLLASAILQYTSTAIAMPWEVGKMLLQVQWVPRDASEPESTAEVVEEEEEEETVSILLDLLFCIGT